MKFPIQEVIICFGFAPSNWHIISIIIIVINIVRDRDSSAIALSPYGRKCAIVSSVMAWKPFHLNRATQNAGDGKSCFVVNLPVYIWVCLLAVLSIGRGWNYYGARPTMFCLYVIMFLYNINCGPSSYKRYVNDIKSCL